MTFCFSQHACVSNFLPLYPAQENLKFFCSFACKSVIFAPLPRDFLKEQPQGIFDDLFCSFAFKSVFFYPFGEQSVGKNINNLEYYQKNSVSLWARVFSCPLDSRLIIIQHIEI